MDKNRPINPINPIIVTYVADRDASMFCGHPQRTMADFPLTRVHMGYRGNARKSGGQKHADGHYDAAISVIIDAFASDDPHEIIAAAIDDYRPIDSMTNEATKAVYSILYKAAIWDIANGVTIDGLPDGYVDTYHLQEWAHAVMSRYESNIVEGDATWMHMDSADHISVYGRSCLWDIAGKPSSMMCCRGRCYYQTRHGDITDRQGDITDRQGDITDRQGGTDDRQGKGDSLGYRFHLIPPMMRTTLLLRNRLDIRDDEYYSIPGKVIAGLYKRNARHEMYVRMMKRLVDDGREDEE